MSELNQVVTGEDGLICAYELKSSSSPLLSLTEVEQLSEDAKVWIHLDRTHPGTRVWLNEQSGLPENLVNSLLKNEVRPRFSELANGQALFVIRAINVNTGDRPEDMVSIRIWSDGRRIISLRNQPLMAAQEIRSALEQGTGPDNVAGFLQRLHKLIDGRIENLVYKLNSQLEELEDDYQDKGEINDPAVNEMSSIAMKLRRHLVAQRDSMIRVRESSMQWLVSESVYWRELYHSYMIYVDELGDIVDRCKTLKDARIEGLIENSNRTSYLLTIVAAIFLPLGFITGLLGINVGGMPGVDSEWAFAIVCLIIVLIGVLEYFYFKTKKWL